MSSDSYTKEEALLWWNDLGFEEQFYKVIEVLGTDKHPLHLNDLEIIKLYKHFC